MHLFFLFLLLYLPLAGGLLKKTTTIPIDKLPCILKTNYTSLQELYPFGSSKLSIFLWRAMESHHFMLVSGSAGHISCWLATACQEKIVSLKIINGYNPPRKARETCTKEYIQKSNNISHYNMKLYLPLESVNRDTKRNDMQDMWIIMIKICCESNIVLWLTKRLNAALHTPGSNHLAWHCLQ